MNRSLPPVAAIAVSVSVALLAGCVPDRPQLDVPADAAVATLAGGAIRFDDHGGPVDVPDDPGRTLTLADAVRMTLRSDPEIQAALSRVRAAEADADQVRLLPNPIVNASVRVPVGFGTPLDLAVTEEVSAVLLRPGRAEAADARLRGAVADALTVVLDRLAEVQERYAAVQSLDALMPVLADRRALVGRLLAVANARLEQGEGTRLDVTTLDAQRLELDVEVGERQGEREQERLTLARLIGRPSSPADWAVDPWEPLPTPAADEAAWVAIALGHRPEVEGGRWELAALGVDVRDAQYAPFVGTFLGGNVADQAPKFQGGPAFTIPVPIFDQGQFARAAASARQLEAEHKLTRVRRDVVEDVRKRLAEFRATSQTLAVARDQLLPTQQRRQAQAEAAYRAGETDVTALVLAEQDYQAARTQVIDLQRRTATSLIRLRRAAGGPGPAEPLIASTRPAATHSR